MEFNTNITQEDLDKKAEEGHYYPHRASNIDFENLEILPDYNKYSIQLENALDNITKEYSNIACEGIQEYYAYLKKLFKTIMDFITRQIKRFIVFVKELFKSTDKEIDRLSKLLIKTDDVFRFSMSYGDYRTLFTKTRSVFVFDSNIYNAINYILDNYRNHCNTILKMCKDTLATNDELPIEIYVYNGAWFNIDNKAIKTVRYDDVDTTVDNDDEHTKEFMLDLLTRLKEYTDSIKELEESVENVKKQCRELEYQIDLGNVNDLDIKLVKAKGMIVPSKVLMSYTELAKEVLFALKYIIQSSPKSNYDMVMILPNTGFGWADDTGTL